MVFFIVITSALLQGSTISNVARWLGLEAPPSPKRIHQLELVSMDKANAEMLEVEISNDSPYLNSLVQDMDLPDDTVISAIIRQGELVMPTGQTELLERDVLYILTDKKQVKALKEAMGEEVYV